MQTFHDQSFSWSERFSQWPNGINHKTISTTGRIVGQPLGDCKNFNDAASGRSSPKGTA
jgi:hypothetical protein